MDRRLLKVSISSEPMEEQKLRQLQREYAIELGIEIESAGFLVFEKMVTNSAYISGGNSIRVKFRDGRICDVAEATDLPNIRAMAAQVKKYIVCQPKPISLQAS